MDGSRPAGRPSSYHDPTVVSSLFRNLNEPDRSDESISTTSCDRM